MKKAKKNNKPQVNGLEYVFSMDFLLNFYWILLVFDRFFIDF